jgi:hypothetical protein
MPFNAYPNDPLPNQPNKNYNPPAFVEDIATTDNDAEYINLDSLNGSPCVWSDWAMNSRLESDRTRYMVPVTAPNGFQGKTVSIVQLASPVLLWIVDWTAMRTGDKPLIPDPTTNDPNWVILDEIYEPASQVSLTDGVNRLYRISGTFIYGHVNPAADILSYVIFPIPPWLTDNAERLFGTNYRIRGLFDRGASSNLNPQPLPTRPLVPFVPG